MNFEKDINTEPQEENSKVENFEFEGGNFTKEEFLKDLVTVINDEHQKVQKVLNTTGISEDIYAAYNKYSESLEDMSIDPKLPLNTILIFLGRIIRNRPEEELLRHDLLLDSDSDVLKKAGIIKSTIKGN